MAYRLIGQPIQDSDENPKHYDKLKLSTTMIKILGLIILSASLLVSSATEAVNETQVCRKDLGMQSGDIKDEAISASSSYDEKSVGPLNARIRTERNGGAWCPKNQISRNVYEWIQVDLGRLHFISQVETQGRFGNGQGQEYVPNYLLEYQRSTGEQWIRYRDRKGSEILKGNSNTYLTELRALHPPIIARAVRFIPYSTHPRTVCMRVELYGCEWTDGISSYKMKQGDKRGGGDLDFSDFTYDGHQTPAGYLTEGLGQLVDRELGNSQFRLDLQSIGKRGFEWVAWKRDDRLEDFVEIVFNFDTVRNFTAVRIHTNNLFSKEIGVFREARVEFSVGGRYYHGLPIVYKNERDVQIEEAKYIRIPISHRIGRQVKLQLFFDARWIMISEIQFESEIVREMVAEEIEPYTATTTQQPEVQTIPLDMRSTPRAVMTRAGQLTTRRAELTIQAVDDNSIDRRYHDSDSNTPSLARSQKDPLIGIVLGTFAAVFIVSTVTGFLLLMRYRRRKFSSPLKSLFIDDHVNFNLSYLGGKKLNGNVYNSIACSDVTDSTKDNEQYAEQSLPNSEVQTQDLEHDINTTAFSSDNQMVGFTSAVNTFPLNSEVSGSIPIPAARKGQVNQLLNLSPDNLRFIARLGDGTFGQVHICEAVDLPGKMVSSQCFPHTGRGTGLVAVRMLCQGATEKERRDFEGEIDRLSNLMDTNLAQMLGVIKTENLVAIVSEYTSLGNLRQFLSQRILENSSTQQRAGRSPTLSHGCLVYLATQISSGMKYLESLDLVHKDLACRNCLVGQRLVVKISDFGTGPSTYPEDYHRTDAGTVEPLRWMSWEAALLKQFSCKSDVWSFGVTLWEIMSFAKSRPFNELTNEVVISNLGHYYRSDGLERHLSQPVGCSKEIYDLMVECWRRDARRRPAFHEIHMFLSRKNLGYSPSVEQPNFCELAQYNLNRV